eukprot:m.245843 g.245843  ORF g.245843 m.245843 type:complete len:182 (-) comp26639_c0_seq12:986-1531(-)
MPFPEPIQKQLFGDMKARQEVEALQCRSEGVAARKEGKLTNDVDVSPGERTLCLVHLAEVLAQQGKIKQACQCYFDCVEHIQTRDTGSNFRLAQCLIQLGLLQHSLKNYKAAVHHCQQALFVSNVLLEDNEQGQRAEKLALELAKLQQVLGVGHVADVNCIYNREMLACDTNRRQTSFWGA